MASRTNEVDVLGGSSPNLLVIVSGRVNEIAGGKERRHDLWIFDMRFRAQMARLTSNSQVDRIFFGDEVLGLLGEAVDVMFQILGREMFVRFQVQPNTAGMMFVNVVRTFKVQLARSIGGESWEHRQHQIPSRWRGVTYRA